MNELAQPDELSRLLSRLLDTRLQRQVKDIDLTSLSRVPPERLAKTAIPNLGHVELVSGPAYAKHYDDLYRSNFHGGERERSDLIVARLIDDSLGKRGGLSPFRIIGLRDLTGNAIGAAHFSVLFLEDCGRAVPYLQYIYIRPENRRQDLSELLHTLVLAVTMALGGERIAADTVEVPFTLCETEPAMSTSHPTPKPDHALDRSKIHSKSGSQALMLRRKSDGKVLSAHLQPGLEANEPPLTYIWALRANPAVDLRFQDGDMGKGLISAYYQSLEDEGFPKENIAHAMQLAVARQQDDAEFCLLPLGEITR